MATLCVDCFPWYDRLGPDACPDDDLVAVKDRGDRGLLAIHTCYAFGRERCDQCGVSLDKLADELAAPAA